jgi:hypothetical protein
VVSLLRSNSDGSLDLRFAIGLLNRVIGLSR